MACYEPFLHDLNMTARTDSPETKGNTGIEALAWPQVSRHAAGTIGMREGSSQNQTSHLRSY